MQDPLSEPLHLVLRRARQAANLRQTALAQQVGCTQSALSMFEGGRASALSAETVRKVAETLGVELPASFPAADAPAGGAFPPSGPAFPALAEPVRFCPNFQCLSNVPYFVGGQLFFLPLPSCGEGARCALCGEILERSCPSCGAPVARRGGCCGACGAPLVAWPDGFAPDPVAWARAQRDALASLRSLAAPFAL